MRAASAYTISSWVFLRLLGVVYGVAFWSLDAQIPGLVGSGGILPAAETMADAARWSRELGAVDRLIQWPTVFWLGTGDAWLTGACRAGILLSIPLIAGVGSVFVLPLLWMLYLSLATVTGDFLAFQWDSLLLESGLLAIAFVPWKTVERPGQDAPAPLARALLWWLLFRLMFASGVVKLTSGDPMWRALTAMSVHYETQPLPTPIGWFAHHLPAWFNEASTFGVLAIELLLPWCILWRGTPRRMAAVGFVALQAGIALTGNYAFFNLLSAALALTLLDDETWRRVVPEQWLHRADDRDEPPTHLQQDGPRVAAVLLAFLVVPVSAEIVASQLRITLPGSHWARELRGELLPLRSINAYGLFAVITPTRPEIALEGSRDGVSWRRYPFKYKPDALTARPRWVAPYQPRLDWQMWFAALGEPDESPWFDRFCRRLLEGSTPVLALLEDNPFPEGPPTQIRATRARYQIASLREWRTTATWWTRGPETAYGSGCAVPDGREHR
ncbi:MAG: lipase maturation factor family protein [Vicinamibacterales bacterium]